MINQFESINCDKNLLLNNKHNDAMILVIFELFFKDLQGTAAYKYIGGGYL